MPQVALGGWHCSAWIGIGGMGSAAVYHLARRGVGVMGLERFDIPHAEGSSHRVNRMHCSYHLLAPLLIRLHP